MSRIPPCSRKLTRKTSGASSGSRESQGVAVISPNTPPGQGPTLLQKRVFKQALSKSALDPKGKVRSCGAQRTTIPVPVARTKRGDEHVLQQMTMEKTVQRTPRGEYIAKTMTGIDANPTCRKANQIQYTSQQIDPAHATESAGVNLTISTTSTVKVTSGGRQLTKTFSKKTVKNEKSIDRANVNPCHVNRLVREEAEDVENTLKMIPPDLVSTSVERFPLKRKLQNLRMNSESIALLEQSVIHQVPTADEVESETQPEVMASVIHAVEKGAVPACAPNQIFNSLFPEVETGSRVPVSSVAPGPLLDIVVPLGQPGKMTEEVLTEDFEKAVKAEVHAKEVLPPTDICVENNITPAPREDEGEKKIPMILEEELPPWEEGNVQKICNLVGGDPIDLLNATDTTIMEGTDVEQEMMKGMDYFIDANTTPYENNVQIRGSRNPEWFPGYMVVFPHYPEVVRIAKSPSSVLVSAWKSVQPKLFPDESLVIA